MSCFHRIGAIACFALLGACATTPAGSPSSSVAYPSALHLCPGGGVANAPAADRDRRVAGYTPTTQVRGVTLARAPVEACLSSGFGPRRGAGGAGGFHDGLDLYTGSPRPIAAGGAGVVEFSGNMRGYGRTIVIRHGNGVSTRYAHLSDVASHIREGRRVSAGEVIGRTGKTGNATAVHLHYEIIIDGRTQNPLTVGG